MKSISRYFFLVLKISSSGKKCWWEWEENRDWGNGDKHRDGIHDLNDGEIKTVMN